MRLDSALIVLSLSGSLLAVACGPDTRHDRLPDARGGDAEQTNCVGLECRVVNCEEQGKPPTTLTGTVYAPNGTLALSGATVYVPLIDPGPFHDGVECTQCVDDFPGGAIADTASNTMGKFTLTNVPVGTDIPLFITIGKWRRKVILPQVAECQENPLPADLTRLPKTKAEGDIPRIAMVTGNADGLECLLRKMGVDDSEFTPASGTGRIHMYVGDGGTPKIQNGAPFEPASTLLNNDSGRMKNYDLMMFGCEGLPNPTLKTQSMMNNLKAYADMGGRVFLEHYHVGWIVGDGTEAPPVWPQVADCHTDESQSGTGVIDLVHNPKGALFSEWMTNVMAGTAGQFPITDSRQSCTSVNDAMAERWVYMNLGGVERPQMFQFTTPLEAENKDRCGKVVFSDMHVASGSFSSSTGFPAGCSASPMSAQEKALSFMLFDIATCVGPIF